MKAIIIACLVLSTLAVELQNQGWTNSESAAFAEIKEAKWGSFIIEYAEVHLNTGGVLQDLLAAIQELIEQLKEELSDLEDGYSRRTDVHNRDVTRYEQEVQDGQRDIFNGQDMIDNVLYPQRDRFQKNLAQLKTNIDENRKNLGEETLQRKKANEEFKAKVIEHNEAIGAVDESVQLLSTLVNPAMVQIKRVQTNLARIHNAFQNHSTFAPIIKALLDLATESNFADEGSIKQLLKVFNELRVQFVDSLNDETAAESEAQAKFETRVAQLEKEFSEFQRAVLLKTTELAANEQKLNETIAYTEQRKQDVATLQAQWDAENDNFARETDIFNNLKTEYLKELEVSGKAYDLLTQPSFESYIKSKSGF